ncbi:uncharacterized protein LOC130504204, partial [Raphanus sativus]|uniref:Uncharacterized protein LOC130504204 n=1 Tax=Raphanus sativus TaxID=3726 RepID=A0A9W3CT94_RAPSA
LANPVVVKKKNEKWRVCIDFTDLNKACPKDSFPLPHIDRLVEATTGHELLSFMDAFFRYNQILMNPENQEKTSFITERGMYCYKVMPFGLKNAGATYQRSTDRCIPFKKLLKGNKKFEWNADCDSALCEHKAYISEPHILSKLIHGELLYLYVATSEHAVSGVLVREENNEQKPVYYVSRSLFDAETRYPVMEKLALAVVNAAQKLRPYFQSHSIMVMTSQLLRAVLHSPSKSGRLAKWAIELGEYDIEYKPRTSSKAQVLADFIIELVPNETDATDKTQKWKLHVDGASSKQGSGIGIQLESPTGEMIEQSFRLGFNASNNEAEYESLIAGDLQLVTSQFHREYEAKNERVEAYLAVLRGIAQQFEEFELTRIRRGENTSADALAALASTSNPTIIRVIPVEGIDRPSIDLPRTGIANGEENLPLIGAIVTRSRSQRNIQDLEEEELGILQNQRNPGESYRRTRSGVATRATPARVNLEEEPDHEVNNVPHKAFQKELESRTNWRIPIHNYIETGELPAERWEARKIKARSSHYCIMEGKLFKRTFGEPYLLCASQKEASPSSRKRTTDRAEITRADDP